jgi:outer membrane protein assembly factor BamB
VSDQAIEELRREVLTGGPEARMRLLQALKRADRPLGEAWPDDQVTVRLDDRHTTDEVLGLLAALDPPRAMDALADARRARIHDLGRDDVWLSARDDGLGVYTDRFDPAWDGDYPNWSTSGWRWRVDAPAYVRLVAADMVGGWAAAAWLGGQVAGGPPARLAADAPAWRWRAPEPPVGLAVGLDREVWVVTASHLHRVAANGAPRDGGLPLPCVASAAAACPRGELLVISDGSRLVALDPTTGAVLWDRPDARHDGSPVSGLAVGRFGVLVAAGDLGVYRRSDGRRRTTGERGSRVTIWEDPESTMGLARDTREITVRDAPHLAAGWLDQSPVTVDRDGVVHRWSLSGNRCAQAGVLGGTSARVLAWRHDRVAVLRGGLVTVHGERPGEVPARGTPTALALAGDRALAGLTDGRVELVDLP